jgi:hypothetical protein
MTSEQFRQIALKLFGPERGWQSRCADALGVDRGTVSRIVSGGTPIVSGPIAAAVTCWNETFERTGKKPA